MVYLVRDHYICMSPSMLCLFSFGESIPIYSIELFAKCLLSADDSALNNGYYRKVNSELSVRKEFMSCDCL